jgi:hypothetical protein
VIAKNKAVLDPMCFSWISVAGDPCCSAMWDITRTKSRRMRWAGHVARMGERIVYRVLVGKPEGNRLMGRPRRRWEDNVKIDLQEVECGVWTGLSRLRIETGGGHLRMR